MSENETLTQDEEAMALETIARLQLEIKEREEQVTALKGFFKTNAGDYPAGTYKENGRFFIKVSSSTRVDDSLARLNLQPNIYDRLTKKTIDGPAAKKGLTAAEYATIVKTYENRIEIGLI